MCPSVFESARHDTVYVPSGSGPNGTWSSSARPGTARAPPASTCAPDEFSTCTVDSFGSGGSVNCSVTRGGDVWRVAPAAGSEEVSSACAPAAGALRHSQSAPDSATASVRFTVGSADRGGLARWSGPPPAAGDHRHGGDDQAERAHGQPHRGPAG